MLVCSWLHRTRLGRGCLSVIAAYYRFLSLRVIYNDPDNAEFSIPVFSNSTSVMTMWSGIDVEIVRMEGHSAW